MKPVIFILGVSALPLAQKLKSALHGEIHTPDCVGGGDVTYARATQRLGVLFKEGRSIIGLCASGILIRAIGPHLSDKRNEPPVVAVAEDGSSAVPLLGGHHGANDLARKMAEICNGHAAITTAGDLRLGLAIDEPPAGYGLHNPEDVKSFTARLLSGEPVRIQGNAPWLADLNRSAAAELEIIVTERRTGGSSSRLVFHPCTLAIGVGCERGTSYEELRQLISETLERHQLSGAAVGCYASIDIKEDEPAILGLEHRYMRFFTADELKAQSARLKNPSEIVERETGTPSVAEAAALAAAGPLGELIVPKTKDRKSVV